MMDVSRRNLIIGAGGLLCLPSIASAQTRADAGGTGELMRLWPGRPPGEGGPSGPIQISAKGAISNVAVPALEVYRPRRPNGMTVLVAAGGGYKRIEMEGEARPAARWLAAHGVTAFVLQYRLPGEGWRVVRWRRYRMRNAHCA